MTEIVADLHLHSNYSDGIHTPLALLELLIKNEIKAFSLTDHDTVSGCSELENCEKISFIPGIELTATINAYEIHILGYYINTETPELLKTLDNIAKKRVSRLFGIVDRLNRAENMNIDKDELAEYLGKRTYNRLNLARFMKSKGICSSLEECFRLYLGDSSESYEAVNYFSPVDAIRLIHKSGGLAFLAHPNTLKNFSTISELVEEKLDGIEVFHPSHKPKHVKRYLEWARQFKLGISGGSDFHGSDNSPRKILSAGLSGERLVDFLALNPNRDFVTA